MSNGKNRKVYDVYRGIKKVDEEITRFENDADDMLMFQYWILKRLEALEAIK
jgi:hypothetical protein